MKQGITVLDSYLTDLADSSSSVPDLQDFAVDQGETAIRSVVKAEN